ncbi:hypothetical protein MA16_Dca025752 [Dendrobium catenatum]|uniref:Uncharacterized protein n=1 Tax=Dendrobium catenatum TaxID=906689 RepID=A0A2I0WCA7_9ASPA|nr:hypothetical protein MA16_Dca025752 [Dendrobium catenatum]
MTGFPDVNCENLLSIDIPQKWFSDSFPTRLLHKQSLTLKDESDLSHYFQLSTTGFSFKTMKETPLIRYLAGHSGALGNLSSRPIFKSVDSKVGC